MKVLFIGGTGTISTAASALLANTGTDLYVMNRGNRSSLIPDNATILKADIQNPDAVRSALQSLRFDAVVDWIAFKPEDVARDIQLFTGITDQYVLISSASVYQKPPAHHVVTEATALGNDFYQYPQLKLACERLAMQAFTEQGFPVTIVRPSYTYDRSMPWPFNSRSAPWTIAERLRSGKPIIVPGDGTSLWTMTHAADFAKGLAGLLGQACTIGQAYHITSDEVSTWDQYALELAAALGISKSQCQSQIVHIASDFIGAFSPSHYGGLMGDKSRSLIFNNNKLRSVVPGYKATIPFREGIRNTVAWFDSHPELQTVDAEFNSLCERILDAYQSALAMAKRT